MEELCSRFSENSLRIGFHGFERERKIKEELTGPVE